VIVATAVALPSAATATRSGANDAGTDYAATALNILPAAVAARVGLKHAETLHRVFRRAVGTTPDRYRQHFGRRAS
jgi:AraC-like DNA-binding protein